MLKKSLITLAVLAGILFLLVYPRVYLLRGSAGGVLYWNATEALLFMTEGNSGARMSYPRYALEPFLVSMGDVRQPDNKRCSRVLVIRVTDNDVQRYDTDFYQYPEEPYCGWHYDLFEGHIYAVSWPRLWRWSGTRFEPATPEELNAFDATKAAAKAASHPWTFDNEDGWSMRELGASAPQYQLTLNGQPVTVVFHGKTWPPMSLSIDLIRSGRSPQKIWSFDGQPRIVSKSAYEHTFGKN